ncbi:MAG: SGNH/GDSL hydrolase family protein [Verrucomicrobiae bacterium]|nr:SGNH/GDSL hydrolase family protein [Verrucomicrobiae bacterium]
MKRFLNLLAIVFLVHLASAEETPVIESGRGVANFLAKIERDKRAHVAFFGGSITQNAGGHSKRVPDWLRERWPEVEFTVTNAGLGSTCSLAGAFRFREDVLAKGPVDLLIVEFAVNDDQDAGHDRRTAIRGLEGILRQYFTANPEGDAISVQFVNPGILAKHQAGEEALSVAAHKSVARHYGIASVDIGLALSREIAAGRMTWEKDYKETHPNPAGYAFATGLITRVIEDSKAAVEIRPIELPEPLDAGSYDQPERVDPQSLSWLGGWRFAPVSKELIPLGSLRADYTRFHALRSDEAGNYLYYTFAGSALSAFVLAGPDAGILEVSVDGGEWRPVDLHHRFSKGLNYPRAVMLAEDLAGTYHTVAIRTAEKKHPESEGHAATILYFGIDR